MLFNMEKHYDLYILRAHYQARAREMLGVWSVDKAAKNLTLYGNRVCPSPIQPDIKNVEKYEIVLDKTNPNLKDLYTQIKGVCPEFSNKKTFHLYWKDSSNTILPVSNYIMYLSMVCAIADSNNKLYLVARDWNELWLNNPGATYIAFPEDIVLVNMVAPWQKVYTATQENQLRVVKSAARPEFTSTYNPPKYPPPSKKSPLKGKTPKKENSASPKSKSAKKKK